jgi:hypothetical protein
MFTFNNLKAIVVFYHIDRLTGKKYLLKSTSGSTTTASWTVLGQGRCGKGGSPKAEVGIFPAGAENRHPHPTLSLKLL